MPYQRDDSARMNSYGCGWNDHPRGCKPEEGAKINAAETEGGLLSPLPIKLSFERLRRSIAKQCEKIVRSKKLFGRDISQFAICISHVILYPCTQLLSSFGHSPLQYSRTPAVLLPAAYVHHLNRNIAR